MLKKNDDFPILRARGIALKVLQKNAHFAHHEHILLKMLDGCEKNVRDQAIQKILKIIKAAFLEENPKDLRVRQFVTLSIDCKATITLAFPLRKK